MNKRLPYRRVKSGFLIGVACLALAAYTFPELSKRTTLLPVSQLTVPPNIILILADDMGYGDPRCYNPDSKVPTPNIDQLAREGMRFTDAHTTSAVCTPTRYGIVTGQYSWRGPLKKGVTWSYDSLIIDPRASTIASLLKKSGYHTSCIGKWHLGLGWQKQNGVARFDHPLTKAPIDLGFDYFFGITASLDIPPYVYIRNRNVVQQPTDSSQGPSPTIEEAFWRNGPVSPDFDHYRVLDRLTQEAEWTITEQAKTKRPFFVYLPLTAPHLPWIPKDQFKGKSKAGNYGDLTAEVDATVGRINDLVKKLGIEGETLIVFTSDNGSQFSSQRMAQYGHRANGAWRGRKGDVYEGGHRVPFIAKWAGRARSGKVPAGGRSAQLVSTTDFYATFADLLGRPMPADEVKDSRSFLPVLTGKKTDPAMLRQSMIYHSSGGTFAIRQQDWVFVKGRGSGGFLEVGDTASIREPYQLYDLADDPKQAKNRYATRPDVARRLLASLDSTVSVQTPVVQQTRQTK
jgi:arylsulfatase A-like enzyme